MQLLVTSYDSERTVSTYLCCQYIVSSSPACTIKDSCYAHFCVLNNGKVASLSTQITTSKQLLKELP